MTDTVLLRIEAAVRARGLDDDASADLVESTLRRLAYRAGGGGKACSRCGRTKPLREFARDARREDGRASTCRACDADRIRARRAKKENP